jgi:glycosyltransferase involved in cell wall biosynthesis
MRLLYVCLDRGVPLGGTKGAGVHAAELLRALEQEGHQTPVVARALAPGFRQGGPSIVIGAELGMRALPSRALRRDLGELLAARRARHAIREAIARFAPDAVYERHSLFHAEAASEAHRARIPHLLEVNAPLAEEQRAFRTLALRRLAVMMERRAWNAADLVVCPSAPLAARVREAGGESVIVVPNGVDPEIFGGEERNGVREELRLEGRFVVCYAGTLKRWHDLESVVDAVSLLPRELAPAMLVVGDGPERDRVIARATERGVELRLTGPVPHADVARCLRAADACVAPLSTDPAFHYFSPLKAMEYLAAGRPTVVAAAGDLASFADLGAALAYRPGDAQDLARALATVRGDAALRERMVRKGQELARVRTWRAAARAIVEAAAAIRGR